MNRSTHILMLILAIALGGCAAEVAPQITLQPASKTEASNVTETGVIIGYLVSQNGTVTMQGSLGESFFRSANASANSEAQPLLVEALPLDASVVGIETLY